MVIPSFEFGLPIYNSEDATGKKKLLRLLRNSFRSFTGLKKTVDDPTINLLMSYDLMERGQRLSYISEQKWNKRCKGQLFCPSQDLILQNNWFVKKDYCENTPSFLIKFINLQTNLCQLKARCNQTHLRDF